MLCLILILLLLILLLIFLLMFVRPVGLCGSLARCLPRDLVLAGGSNLFIVLLASLSFAFVCPARTFGHRASTDDLLFGRVFSNFSQWPPV